jgi:ribose transport system permease protein
MSSTHVTERRDADEARGRATNAGGAGRRGQWAERAALPVAAVALFVVFSALLPERFLSMGNVSNILGSQSILFMLALAALLPSMVGDIDLSLGGIGGLAAIVVAMLDVNHGVPIAVACLVGVAAGAACGASTPCSSSPSRPARSS